MRNINLLFVSMALFGCATEPIDEEQAMIPDSSSQTTQINTQFSSPRTAEIGTKESWRTECYEEEDFTEYFEFNFENNTVVLTTETYSDENCEDIYSIQEEIHNYSFVGSDRMLVIFGSTAKMTPESELSVEHFNDISKCGFTDWEHGVTKTCNINQVEPFNAGTPIYCTYHYTDSLYMTCRPDTYPTEEFTQFHLVK